MSRAPDITGDVRCATGRMVLTVREATMTVTIPFSASATYDGAPGTIGEARDFAGDFLVRAEALHGVPVTTGTAGTVKLVVSELVTNAAKYAPGPCLLDLAIGRDRTGLPDLQITVWDTDDSLPRPGAPDPERIGGHGLELVLALCTRYDIQRLAGGKRVRVHVALR
ncbi:ATP-binding protein [Streptomyces sp. NBC_00237]|uniref:ATP-binding protein n=1 Tax=Streptomyces sp. NBC_00237 TaxID=2975687 RepID=UPI002251978E|nr:ATP-binding protein [Streptomyces sp. NBC_00237]MCX5200215.1 ATP-binding protein [Streptomyces sp. NBC_00237]